METVEALFSEIGDLATPFEAFEVFFFEIDQFITFDQGRYEKRFSAIDGVIVDRHSGSFPEWLENGQDNLTPASIIPVREACYHFVRSGINPDTLLTTALEWFVVLCRERTKSLISQSEDWEELLGLESDLEHLRKVFEIVKRSNRS